MSEEKKDLLNEETADNAPATENKMSKKTKAVIIAVAAIAVVVIVILIGFGIGGDADKNVGEETASSGETTTLLPGIENGVVVDLNGQNGASSGGASGGNSSSGSGSGSGSSSQNGSSSGSGSQSQGGSSGETPTQGEATTVPENRNITVYVVMPENNRTTDTLEIYINGEKIDETFEVNVDGSTYRYTTPEKYKGDVTFEARLLNYGTSVSSIAYEGTDSVELRLPLNRAEENLGDDF